MSMKLMETEATIDQFLETVKLMYTSMGIEGEQLNQVMTIMAIAKTSHMSRAAVEEQVMALMKIMGVDPEDQA